LKELFTGSSENRATLISRVKNRVSRKARERSPGEFARLFRYLSELNRYDAALLPSLVPLSAPAGQFALFEFHDPELRIYSGLEFIVFDERRYLYYRLPGALPNGAGHVAPGRYHVRLNAIADPRELFVVLEKGSEPAFTLLTQSLRPAPSAVYTRLEARELDYSWIVRELRGLVVSWLTSAQALDEARTPPAGTAGAERLRELLRACPADDPEISSASHVLMSRLAARPR
jgi:hypothetical protein